MGETPSASNTIDQPCFKGGRVSRRVGFFGGLSVLLVLGLGACTRQTSNDVTREAAGSIATAKRAHVVSPDSASAVNNRTDEEAAIQAVKPVTKEAAEDASDAARAVVGVGKNGAHSAVHNKW